MLWSEIGQKADEALRILTEAQAAVTKLKLTATAGQKVKTGGYRRTKNRRKNRHTRK